MTGADAPVSLSGMLDERRHLLEVAAWLFDAAAADLIVQETYRRWYVLGDRERADITTPRAWLTETAGGICLDLLAGTTSAGMPAAGALAAVGGARPPRPGTGREAVAEWLRRNPQQDHSDPDLLAGHDEIVRRFAAACTARDTVGLRAVLAADAIVVSDGGGKVRAAAEPTRGAAAVAAFVRDLLGAPPHPVVRVASVNGRAGLLVAAEGRVVAVVSLSVAAAAVTAVWITLNPDKLRPWQRRLPRLAPLGPPASPERRTEP